MKMFRLLPLAAGLALGVSAVASQDFNKGTAAFQSGDIQTALAQWIPLAKRGNTEAQIAVGLIYEHGYDDVKANYSEAYFWYKRAKDLGDDQADYSLSMLYITALDHYLYKEGLDRYKLGYEGANRHPASLDFQKMFANLGYYEAQYWMGWRYETGTDVLQDFNKAIAFYRALVVENNRAFIRLGEIFLKKNETGRAHMWYNIASANEIESAAEMRDRIALKMTPEEVLKAQVMASECMSSGYKNCGW